MNKFEAGLERKREVFRVNIRAERNKKRNQHIREKLLRKIQQPSDSFSQRQFSCLVRTVMESDPDQPEFSKIFQLHKSMPPPQQQSVFNIYHVVQYFQILKKLIVNPSLDEPTLLYLDMLVSALTIITDPSLANTINDMIPDFTTILKRNNYATLQNNCRKYLSKLIDVLNILVTHQVHIKDIDNLKNAILNWASGTHAIELVANSITNFIWPKTHEHIYKLLTLCFKSNKDPIICEEAVRAVQKLCKNTDYDEIETIHNECPELFPVLLHYSMKQSLTLQVRLQCFKAIQSLMDVYENTIQNLVKFGVLELVMLLLSSESQESIIESLRTISCLSTTEPLTQILVESPITVSGKLWPRVFQFCRDISHLDIQKQALSILHKFILTTTYDNLNKMLGLVEESEQANILEIIGQILRSRDANIEYTLYCVQILHCLLYYSRKNMKLTNNQNVLLLQCHSKGIIDNIRIIFQETKSEQLQMAIQLMLTEQVDFVPQNLS